MSENRKNELIYRCPTCFNNANDVVITKDGEGIYRCAKCSYSGTLTDLEHAYDQFRERYRMLYKRLTLEEQRKM